VSYDFELGRNVSYEEPIISPVRGLFSVNVTCGSGTAVPYIVYFHFVDDVTFDIIEQMGQNRRRFVQFARWWHHG